jgi:hypothetical protein
MTTATSTTTSTPRGDATSTTTSTSRHVDDVVDLPPCHFDDDIVEPYAHATSTTPTSTTTPTSRRRRPRMPRRRRHRRALRPRHVDDTDINHAPYVASTTTTS